MGAAVVLTVLAIILTPVVYIALCAWQLRTLIPSGGSTTGSVATTQYNLPFQICVLYTFKLFSAGRLWVPFVQTPNINK